MGETINLILMCIFFIAFFCGLEALGIDIANPDHLQYQGEQIVSRYTGYTIGDNFYTVHPGNYVGSDGEEINLINNGSAVDPTYAQVIDFTLSDPTSEMIYTSNFQCGDFAEMYHNNAEAAGYNCSWVSAHFKDGGAEHACNAFNTTDRGMVFVDCVNGDTCVNLQAGSQYTPRPIQDNGFIYDSLGIVSYYLVYW